MFWIGVLLVAQVVGLGFRWFSRPTLSEGTIRSPLERHTEHAVLFVGNSQLLYRNVPSMVARLGSVTGFRITPSVIARDGANLAGLWRDEHARLAQYEQSDAVVLVESIDLAENRSYEPEFRLHARRFVAWANAHDIDTLLFATMATRQHADGGDRMRVREERFGRDEHVAVVASVSVWPDADQGDLYAADAAHPSVIGSYLNSLLIYRALTGECFRFGSEDRLARRQRWEASFAEERNHPLEPLGDDRARTLETLVCAAE